MREGVFRADAGFFLHGVCGVPKSSTVNHPVSATGGVRISPDLRGIREIVIRTAWTLVPNGTRQTGIACWFFGFSVAFVLASWPSISTGNSESSGLGLRSWDLLLSRSCCCAESIRLLQDENKQRDW